MKKIFLLTCLMGITILGFSQKYAIIDTRYILDKMPDYKTAQSQLDNIATGWQKEIDTRQTELDNMYKAYESEQVMLSDDLKKKREDQLFNKEKNCGIFNVNALVLREICLKKGRN